MKASFQIYDADPLAFAGDALILILRRDEGPRDVPDEGLARAVAHLGDLGDMFARPEQTPCLYPALMAGGDGPPCRAARLIPACVDASGNPDQVAEELRLCGGRVAGRVRDCKAKEALVLWPGALSAAAGSAEAAVRALVEGLALGGYAFTGYRREDPKDPPPPDCRFHLAVVGTEEGAAGAEGPAAPRRAVREAEAAAAAVCMARDLAHTPANLMTPAAFAARARSLAEESGTPERLSARVLERPDLERLGLNGLLAVAAGSARPPTLSVLEYHCGPDRPTALLVGKGLTFDSGGLCLKSASGMAEMKMDMCGGAAVLAVLRAWAELGADGLNVVGLVPATENLSGSSAMRPGDVVRHFGGLHSEVTNTDAEGRLILADALAWGIAEFRPNAVIDVATLTGAAIVGLGHHYSALLSNNDALANDLAAAGAAAGEPLWRLPLGPAYRKQLESRVADIKNAGPDRSGGTITAACFLREFVGDTPWAHLDIAGTAWNFTEKSYVPKGPSGVGVRTLLRFLADWNKQTRSGVSAPK